MTDSEEPHSPGHAMAFPGELGRAELEQEVARRTARRFSLKALRAALFPQHLGKMDHPDGYARAQGHCGDLITFYLRIKNDRIHEITFTTDGCDATIAVGEMLSSIVIGMSLAEAGQVMPDDLLAVLDGMPPNHAHCADLAIMTLSEAIESYQGDRDS